MEGWHEGSEWIDSGSLVERVNFAARYLGNIDEPGVRDMIDRLTSSTVGTLSPEELVDGCLDLIGPITVDESTRQDIIDHVAGQGDGSERRIADVLKLIVSSREFQLA